ncbi:MAG: hypothetical protein NZX77_10560 [Polyangiaceae bacterium]|nr:hypothetical protein [Polyangiaceae bacterium]
MKKKTWAVMGLVVGLLAACADDTNDSENHVGAGETAGNSTAGSGGSKGGAGGWTAGTGGSDAGSGGGNGGTGGVPGCDLVLPTSYDGAAFETNAKVELAVIGQLKALNNLMKEAEADLTKKPTKAELVALLEAGDPSLKEVMTSYYAGYVDGVLGAFAEAAGKEAVPSDPPSGQGGLFGKWIFDEKGTDLRQAFEKGAFGAALFHHASKVVAEATGAADVDRLIAIFGAHPSFPGDDKDPNHPDVFSASYAERRDAKDPTNPGHYFRFKAAAIKAQAAAAKGDACKAEFTGALRQMMTEWEQSHFATVVYYLNDAAKKLTTEPATNDTLAGGLHSYGEAVGFLHGFKGLPAEVRTITDTQIDELLALLNATPGDVKSYKLVSEAATEAPKLLQVLQKTAGIYGFTAQQIEGYKTNY